MGTLGRWLATLYPSPDGSCFDGQRDRQVNREVPVPGQGDRPAIHRYLESAESTAKVGALLTAERVETLKGASTN